MNKKIGKNINVEMTFEEFVTEVLGVKLEPFQVITAKELIKSKNLRFV